MAYIKLVEGFSRAYRRFPRVFLEGLYRRIFSGLSRDCLEGVYIASRGRIADFLGFSRGLI